MVAKITVGTSLYGALAYNGMKVNEGEGKLLAVNKVFDDGRTSAHGTRSSTSPSIRIPTTA